MPEQEPSKGQSANDAILTLSRWFSKRSRALPWRAQPTLYRVWVSEIMLQQTQVATVLPYFERFMERFPTVEALASAEEASVLEVWAGLGYYSRARNLHRGAKQIAKSGFPQNRQAWLEIPGVGPYTAGAICSIALGQPEPILDGNVERVLSRVLLLSRSQGDASFKAHLWRWSGILVRRANRLRVSPSAFNQAVMELGALVCTFKSPRCSQCPLSKNCLASSHGNIENYPGKKPAKEWIQISEVRHAWIFRAQDRSEKILLRKQALGEWREGLWDFPAEPPSQAIRKKGKPLGEVLTKHVVTRHKISRITRLWSVSNQRHIPKKQRGEFSWTDLQEPALPGSAAFQKTWRAILKFSSGNPQ
ncbi:MAG: A/G-specific adenine glycosylase [Bdellovibrionales bacterium]|nr:A/G-specific adenine glycosylase [Bdellovibrionales bacterium]